MNLGRLKKNVGWWMEIVPPACHLDDRGNRLPEKNEDWRVEEVTDDLVRLYAQSGHQVKLGTDHIYNFATNPQRRSETEGNFGFLTLHVQVFVQGDRVFVKPNAHPGEQVSVNPAVVDDKIVTFSYPTESGIQQRLEAAGFRLQWSLESELASRVDLHGWEIVVEPDAKGKLSRFRCKDPRDDQILIKKRISDGALLSDPEEEDQRSTEKLPRQSEARRYLSPELVRTINRVLYIHSRAIANFVCASAENDIKPNDRKEDFIPHWPALYPNAPQCSDLAADDAAALSAFYDSLHSLADFVNDGWEREGQLPMNIFNMILHHADQSLRLALICVTRFKLENQYPQPFEWEKYSSSIERSLAIAADAVKHHIERYEAKAATKA